MATFFNGFEGIGPYSTPLGTGNAYATYPYNTPYSEGGITVTDVITAATFDPAVYLNLVNYWGGVENYNWYTAASSGYVEIRLTSGAEIQTIQSPTLVLMGDRDVPLAENGVSLFRLLPHAQLCILPGTDHDLICRSPLVPQIVDSFLG